MNEVPFEINLDELNTQDHPSLVLAREWYDKINEKLGNPLPGAYIGMLPESEAKENLGMSAFLEFEGDETAVVLFINKDMLFCTTTWMAVLTHEMTHLLNPELECGTHTFEDKIIELRRKVLDPEDWRLM